MDSTTIAAALIGGALTGAGWLISYIIRVRDEQTKEKDKDVEKNAEKSVSALKEEHVKDIAAVKLELHEIKTESSACSLAKNTAHSDLQIKIHQNQLEIAKLQGDLRLMEANHKHLDDAVDNIQQTIVPRAEWDSRMTAMEQMLRTVLSLLQKPSQSTASLPVVHR